MTTRLRRTRPVCAALALALVLCGCNMRDVYDGQIKRASRAIDTARNDADRAAAYADRGRGYSDKARYLMFRKAIDREDYLRMFDLAIKDHDRAVTLDPGNAEVYFKRGLSFYDRAAQVQGVDSDQKPWFEAARSDFRAATEKDVKHAMAYDYLGLVDEQTGGFDEAIVDYTHEQALSPRLGKLRLADAYCNRGQSFLEQKDYDRAADALESSVKMGMSADGCSCEPYNALAFIYIDVQRHYDRGWDLVRRARDSHNVIAPEYVERLKRASGRSG